MKLSDRFETGRPFDITSAAPRVIVIMPSVTTKGAILPFVITTPLTRPMMVPLQSPTARPTGRGSASFCTDMAVNTPVRATYEPNPRSMPPLRITKVAPTARTALMATWFRMLAMFGCVRKTGDVIEKIPQMSSSATTIPYSRIFPDTAKSTMYFMGIFQSQL